MNIINDCICNGLKGGRLAQGFILVSICGFLAFAPACSCDKSAGIDSDKGAGKAGGPKKTMPLMKPSKQTIDPWIRAKYYDPEEQAMHRTISSSLEELLTLDPAKDASRISEVANALKPYGDTAVRAVAETLEARSSLRERIALIGALEVLNSKVADRYLPQIMDDIAQAGAQSAGGIEVILEIVKNRPDAADYFKDLYLVSKEIDFRKKVVGLLGGLNNEEASAAISEIALNDQQMAPLAIKAMGGIETAGNAERLVDMLLDPGMSPNRQGLIEAIKKQEEYTAAPLVDALRRAPEEKRMDMIKLIGQIGGVKVYEELGYYFGRYYSAGLKTNEKLEILNLVGQAPEAAAKAAEDALNDEDVAVKRAAVDLLRRNGTSRALIVLKAYEDNAGPLKPEVSQAIKAIESKGR